MPAPPWSLETGLRSVVRRWEDRAETRGCFTAVEKLPAEPPTFSDFPPGLDDRLTGTLRKRGIEQLYTHQREAIDAALGGRHTIIATPTASGKSLCFHLPVLDSMCREPGATALYLYPTKALSRDQEQGIHQLVREAELPVGAIVYDGDTPGDARRAARQRGQIVMTNPDMLHAGILPQHASWARVFQNLRYVVLDELHTYRGVFGSHVGNVLSRLRRVARFHGADPCFIGATATIGNPAEHASRLLGVAPKEVSVIDRSTAPRGERQIYVYNPPVVNAELGIRASYLKRAVYLASDLIRARVPTILFGQSRNAVEIMLKYLRDRFHDQAAIRDAIVAYRSGYLPDQRRRVERGLRAGEIVCVVATSALELGIDIGDLDAVVCAGYPGSLAETWQRFGRAGRRNEGSIAVLISKSSPVDQYVAQHPRLLFEGGAEHARIEPENVEIAVQHLKCAAFELPFRSGEAFGTLPAPDTEAALGFLEEHGVLHRGRDRFHWAADAFPANQVSLRSIGWDNTVIIDVDTEQTIAELDWHATPTMLHEQAIYQHDGRQYQVEELDHENHKAYVRLVQPDYFTTAMRHVKVRVIEDEAGAWLDLDPRHLWPPRGDDEAREPSSLDQERLAHAGWGDVCVTEKVVGYKKIKFHTHENAGYGEVRLPEVDLHTTSFYLTLPSAFCSAMGRSEAVEGLRGLAHALELTATLALMCDPRDLARAIEDASPDEEEGDAPYKEAFSATAYLYDNVPGGVGLAERIFERGPELIRDAAQVIANCSCAYGCPSCVGATAAGAQDQVPAQGFDRRRAALKVAVRLGVIGLELDRPPPAGDDTPAPRPAAPHAGHLRLVT